MTCVKETGAWPSMTGNLLEEHLCDGKISAEDEADIRGAAATIYSGKQSRTASNCAAITDFSCSSWNRNGVADYAFSLK